MKIHISDEILKQIQAHGEAAYPEEGAGFLFGSEINETRRVTSFMGLDNSREDGARHNRYLLTADDYLKGERQAIQLGLDVVGVFHSHPDHPDIPSEFDRDWALPWFSYMITSVQGGRAASSRSWRLSEDRTRFEEETMEQLK